MELKELLTATTALGYDILRHGAETYRVEECITRMCRAYGYPQAEVFVIPSSIVVTITAPDGEYLTRTRRVLRRDTDLDKVDRLNALARRICETTPTYTEVITGLETIEAGPVYGNGTQLFGFGSSPPASPSFMVGSSETRRQLSAWVCFSNFCCPSWRSWMPPHSFEHHRRSFHRL